MLLQESMRRTHMNIEFTKDDRTVSLKDVIDYLNKQIYDYDKTHFEGLCKDGPYKYLVVEPGNKYIKIVTVLSSSDSRSVYCFLDKSGNIYKAASWKAPAKHIRGTVFDENYGWGKSLGNHGAAYLR